jgi:outer membrane receptor protein involved in Fe transport
MRADRFFSIASAAAAAVVMASSSQAAELEEVVITAQKREQSLDDVPIAVSAISGDQMRANLVTDIFDLRGTIPALEIRGVDPPSQGTSFAIRGLGTSVFNMGFEPSVSTFVDGVYRSRSGLVASNDLLDIERIEVLKGPQGTLFGKNTTGGVVHIITKAPNLEEFEGEVGVSYEEYNRARLNAILNVPLSDTVATRWALSYGKGDGYLDNLTTGEEIEDLDRFTIRGQLLWEPSDRIRVRLQGDYSELDEKCCVPPRNQNDVRTGPINGPLAASIGSTIVDPADLDGLVVANNVDPQLDVEDFGLSAEIEWEIGNLTLTSVTAYRDYEDENFKDNGFTGVDILLSRQNLPEVSLFSQEFRVAGVLDNVGQGLDWIIGGYYADEDIERSNEFIWGSQIGVFPFGNVPGRAFLAEFEHNAETIAGFAHGTLRMTDKWALTAGLRYTSDEKEARSRNDQPQALPLPIVYDFNTETDDSEPSGTVSLQYDWTEDAMMFLQYSRGFKSGGISLNRDAAGAQFVLQNPPPFPACAPGGTPLPMIPLCAFPEGDPTFKKETADHFELGLKSTWLDNSLRVNASIFLTQFDDLQLQTLRPDGTFDVVNVEGAEALGVEVETNWAVTDYLSIDAALMYLDATFDDGIGVIDPAFPDPSGEDLPFSSEWTGSVGASYDRPIAGGNWDWFANGTLFFRSDQFVSTLPRDDLKQAGYGLFNARTGLRTGDGQWEFSVWCRNCFDKRYVLSEFSIPFDGAVFFPTTTWSHIGGPRFWGGTATFRF